MIKNLINSKVQKPTKHNYFFIALNNFLNYIDKPTKTITDEDGYDIVVTNQINLKVIYQIIC